MNAWSPAAVDLAQVMVHEVYYEGAKFQFLWTLARVMAHESFLLTVRFWKQYGKKGEELILFQAFINQTYFKFVRFHSMLGGSLVTTAWRVLRLRMEGTPSRYGG
jgi:hypothetical protein